MTFPEFDKFMDALYEECKGMRNTKGKEYAHAKDRFANFRRIAAELETTDLKVAYTYYKKHLDSVISYIKTGGQVYSTEPIRGRFVDLIVYSFLMAGMAEELERGKDDTKLEYIDPEFVERMKNG